jgi:integrase
MQWGGETTHLDPLLTRFKGTPLADIGQDAIDKAALELKPGRAPSTWNRQIYTPICAVLNHAAAKTPPWCPALKIKRPKAGEARVRWITFDEAERLIEAARPHLKPLVIFLLATGVRISEALYLDWKDVDLSRCHVTIYGEPDEDDAKAIGTKNGEARGIPLHPRAVAALANLRHRTGAVFRRPKKGPRAKDPSIEEHLVGKPYASRGGRGGGQIKSTWKTLCKDAGIENFTPHDCRHTWATWHYMANKDLTKLMELGGWKSLDMVMRYTHVDKSNLKSSIDDMWAMPAKKRKAVK